MNRGEVWLVDFDPSVGAEIQKRRRGIIISQDGFSELPVRIVVPLTGWQPHFAQWPWMIYLKPTPANGLTKVVAANAFQVKCLSTDRLVKKFGAVTAQELADIAAAVSLVVGHENQ